ncbi:MAG: B12-binding domain-containing radical SAM protein [Candidatus Kryptoniota bacterium]
MSNVDAVDTGVLNFTWMHVFRLLSNEYDVIAVVNDFDSILVLRQFVCYARKISPASKIVTFGTASLTIPQFFVRYDVDAICASGDVESSLADYVRFVAGDFGFSQLHGILLRNRDGSSSKTEPGLFLDPEKWCDPDTREVPWSDYAKVGAKPDSKTSTIRGTIDLPVTISKGCPLKCRFCLVSLNAGQKERRRTIDSVFGYLEAALSAAKFDCVSTYSPTFTLDREWALSFSQGIHAQFGISWKTCTSVTYLDEEIISAFASGGCVRISVGLECFNSKLLRGLSMAKVDQERRLRKIAAWCNESGIELNCFLMLGLPGQEVEDISSDKDLIQELGAKLRMTAYTPYQNLHDSMTEDELVCFCRWILVTESQKEEMTKMIYSSLFGK